MKYVIFYSWQSDLPNNTNRGFIEGVLNESFSQLINNQFEIDFALDRDTKNVPGSPNIGNTIIDKIKKCDVFVADISIINSDSGEKYRKTPNPNVLLELGYALALLGTEKILLFFNESYGDETGIPFDIRQNRRISYSLLPDGNKAQLRKELGKSTAFAIKEIINSGRSLNKKEPFIKVDFFDIKEDKIIDTDLIINKYDIDISNEMKNARKDLDEILKIDGSMDPKWNSKVELYKDAINSYIEYLENKSKDYYLSFYRDKYTKLTLSVSNVGNLAATDIRISIIAPPTIMLLKEFPTIEEKEMPQKPKIEIPISAFSFVEELSKVISNSINIPLTKLDTNIYGSNIAPFIRNRTHSCTIRDDNEIYFKADKLLHKFQIIDKDEFFIIIPSADLNQNEIELIIDIYCAEYEDWEKQKIIIKIKNGA